MIGHTARRFTGNCAAQIMRSPRSIGEYLRPRYARSQVAGERPRHAAIYQVQFVRAGNNVHVAWSVRLDESHAELEEGGGGATLRQVGGGRADKWSGRAASAVTAPRRDAKGSAAVPGRGRRERAKRGTSSTWRAIAFGGSSEMSRARRRRRHSTAAPRSWARRGAPSPRPDAVRSPPRARRACACAVPASAAGSSASSRSAARADGAPHTG